MTEIIKETLLFTFLDNVAFDGWNETSFQAAQKALNVSPLETQLHFPNGVPDMGAALAAFLLQQLNDYIENETHEFANLRVTEKIKTSIHVLLQTLQPHHTALPALMAHYAWPGRKFAGLKLIYHLASEIWYLCGDQATDWNYYSKRTLLSYVLVTTLIYYLQDYDSEFPATKAFLDQRIQEVLKIPQLKENLLYKIKNPPLPSVKRFMKALKMRLHD